MIWIAFTLSLLLPAADPAETPPADDAPSVIIVVGAGGMPEYTRQFSTWADRWETAAQNAGAKVFGVGRAPLSAELDRAQLQRYLAAEQKNSPSELWLILIGHGTFDGRSARFNLRGPDVSAAEFNQWLVPFDRPVAVINCASSSGPFINRLSAPRRVVISGTKSGFEQNYARFGDYLSQAIADPQSDLDKDGQTSLLEAWLTASRKTEDFYRIEGRLATEHALLDDNGDGLGARVDMFRGVRPVKKLTAGKSHDGYRAHQFYLVRSRREQRMSQKLRRKRDELELAVIRLRERKGEFSETEYLRQLETILLPLAELYEQADARPCEQPVSAK